MAVAYSSRMEPDAYGAECIFVYVTFPDPVTMKKITIKMYPGDRTAEPYWIDSDGNPITYQSCKVNLIDCGE